MDLSEIEKRLQALENFHQQRSHLEHKVVPPNTDGIKNEVRVFFDGTNTRLMTKNSAGIWVSTGNMV